MIKWQVTIIAMLVCDVWIIRLIYLWRRRPIAQYNTADDTKTPEALDSIMRIRRRR